MTNGAQSEGLGVSTDSNLHTTMDLSDFRVKRIMVQKAKMFKAPVGWRVLFKGGISTDVVSNLYSDESESTFEELPYVKLQDD